ARGWWFGQLGTRRLAELGRRWFGGRRRGQPGPLAGEEFGVEAGRALARIEEAQLDPAVAGFGLLVAAPVAGIPLAPGLDVEPLAQLGPEREQARARVLGPTQGQRPVVGVGVVLVGVADDVEVQLRILGQRRRGASERSVGGGVLELGPVDREVER